MDMSVKSIGKRQYPNRRQPTLSATASQTVQDNYAIWRAHLLCRARKLREKILTRSMSGSDGAGDAVAGSDPMAAIELLSANGFEIGEARTAIQLLDRLTLGLTLAEKADAFETDGFEPLSFEAQLDLAIAGLASKKAVTADKEGKRFESFHSDLWKFLRNARDSANIAFARVKRIAELDRRIILLLHAKGRLNLSEIAFAAGVDKAQISRALKRLLAPDVFLERSGLRGKISLSEGGHRLARQLVRSAKLGSRELTLGIPDAQLKDCLAILDRLIGRSIALFERERETSAAMGKGANIEFPDHEPYNLPKDRSTFEIDRSQILPPFTTLYSYLSRAGSLSLKRSAGLSNFDTWVQTEICRDPPISWPQLVLALARDQRQADRTTKNLVNRGLITRTGKAARRLGSFAPTLEGQRICEVINTLAASRSAYLFEGLDGVQLTNFMHAFALLNRHAQLQLVREKAAGDIAREEG